MLKEYKEQRLLLSAYVLKTVCSYQTACDLYTWPAFEEFDSEKLSL